jgi:autonomous glycyl radical cofactor GrcA
MTENDDVEDSGVSRRGYMAGTLAAGGLLVGGVGSEKATAQSNDPRLTLGSNWEIDDDGDDLRIQYGSSGPSFKWDNSESVWVLSDKIVAEGGIESEADVDVGGNDVSNVNSLDTETLNNDIKLVDPTDGHTAVETAIDELPTAGGTIILTEGTAVWSGTATLDKVGLTVRGVGRAPTHLRRTGGGDVFDVTAGDVTIENMRFSGDRSGGPHSAVNVDANRCTLRDIRLSKFDKGIRVASGFFHKMKNVDGRNMVVSLIEADGANDLNLQSVTYDTDTGTYPEPTEAAVHIINMDAVQAEDCDFIRGGRGVAIEPTSGNDSKWHKFEGSYIGDTCSNESLRIAGNGDVRGIQFDSCWFATSSRGVTISGTNTVDTVKFTNCQIHNHENEGVRVTNDNADNIIFDGGVNAGNNEGGGSANAMYFNFDGYAEVANMNHGQLMGWTSQHRDHVMFDSGQTAGRCVGNRGDGSATNVEFEDVDGTNTFRNNDVIA